MARPTRRLLRDIESELDTRDLLHEIRKICKKHHATLGEVVLGVREPHAVKARHAIVLFLSKQGFSSPVTGKLLNLDHSSVLYVLKRDRESQAS